MTGRLLVLAQGVLLVLLASAPVWVESWTVAIAVTAVGAVAVLCGAAVLSLAMRDLGSALTPLPEPRAEAELRTSGLYGRVRHPIYSGLLLAAWGWVGVFPSWVTVVGAALLTTLLTVKSTYEERLLRERFAEYARYAARVPRFLPRAVPQRGLR